MIAQKNLKTAEHVLITATPRNRARIKPIHLGWSIGNCKNHPQSHLISRACGASQPQLLDLAVYEPGKPIRGNGARTRRSIGTIIKLASNEIARTFSQSTAGDARG